MAHKFLAKIYLTLKLKIMEFKKNNVAKTPYKSQSADDLSVLFEDQLKNIYWAGLALTKASPKMAKNATIG